MKLLLPTAAALGAGAAVAVGQIPGSGGAITGCYQDVPIGTNGADYPYGTLRVIDPGKAGPGVDPSVYSCGTNEQTITWNQQGQPGQPGATGPQGSPAQIMGESTFSVTASKTERVYLKLDGVPGDVTQKGLGGTISVDSFAVGASGAVSGADKVTVQSFEITRKRGGPADPILWHDTIDGTQIPKGEVIIVNKSAVEATYQFEKILITSIQTSGTVDHPVESITLNFDKLKTTIGSGPSKLSTPWSSPHSLGGFDLKTNKTA